MASIVAIVLDLYPFERQGCTHMHHALCAFLRFN